MKKVLLLLLIASSLCLAQTTLKTFGVSPRAEQVSETDIFDRAYNAVQNVGVGTKVFLVGADTVLTNPTWEITKKPAGSQAVIGDKADIDNSWYDTHDLEWVYERTQVTSFIADKEGEYEIKFTNGSESATIRIVTATYLGVKNCQVCHKTGGLLDDGKYDAWAETGHATALKEGLDGEKGSHFRSYCVSCHSTGYDTYAANDGFDDFEFVFPSELKAGMYDSLSNVYQAAMNRANIQCESCHGPGSQHLGQSENIAVTLSSDNCAVCHDAGTYHVYPDQWSLSAHASGHTLYYQGGSRDRSSCMPCHNGQGFVDHLKGKPQTETQPIEITCATCHDPHDATNKHQVRTLEVTLGNGEVLNDGGMGKLCMNCHKGRRDAPVYAIDVDNLSSHYGPHHGPQADMLSGKNIPNFGEEYESTTGHFTFIENTCVQCHMYPGGVDDGGNVIRSGSHTFRMSTPEGVDNMAACSGCHPSFTEGFDKVTTNHDANMDLDMDGEYEGLQGEIKGLHEFLGKHLPPYWDPAVDYKLIEANYTETLGIAYFNYKFIEEDKSWGIHNPKLAIDMLMKSIEALGGIVSVTELEDEEIPQVYELHQNYPNPFNPETTIGFSIPEESDVKIVVYDAIGSEVSTLIDEVKPAGTYTVRFNGYNLASGIYFYKIKAGDFVQVKKAVLLK